MIATARIPHTQPTVGLITIWYRSIDALDQFTANLESLTYSPIRTVFVINSQSVEEVERLRASVPAAIILEPRANLGCAAAWNLACQHLLAEGVDYVGIWNVDVRLDPRCLDYLVSVMEN